MVMIPAETLQMMEQETKDRIADARKNREWQPIKTAPMSHTILLFAVTDVDDDGRIRNWKMATGWWHTGYEDDAKVTPWCWDGHQVPKYGVQPTHWMMLPAPPRDHQ